MRNRTDVVEYKRFSTDPIIGYTLGCSCNIIVDQFANQLTIHIQADHIVAIGSHFIFQPEYMILCKIQVGRQNDTIIIKLRSIMISQCKQLVCLPAEEEGTTRSC